MAIQKRVIVCPLDWGLGHATRCVPVIRELTKRGAQVFIASSGGALELLRQEFPQLVFFEFPSYDPVYQGKGSMSFSMILQLPKFRKVIEEEHVVLERLIQENKIDIVISDNRYGCWTSSVKSVFITHQVNLLMPKGFIWMSPGVNHLLHQYIKKFSQVWIPDMPEAELTKPFTSRSVPNQKYIGWLSRFEGSRPVKQQFDILALVSGPEPQRSMFEKIVTDELKRSGLKSLLVVGKPDTPFHIQKGRLEIVNHLTSDKLQTAIRDAGVVICRSGYSSVMDLIAMGKKAIFVPTPQQPEQVFLADYLKEQVVAFSMDQKKFSVKEGMKTVDQFKGLSYYEYDNALLLKAIDSIVA